MNKKRIQLLLFIYLVNNLSVPFVYCAGDGKGDYFSSFLQIPQDLNDPKGKNVPDKEKKGGEQDDMVAPKGSVARERKISFNPNIEQVHFFEKNKPIQGPLKIDNLVPEKGILEKENSKFSLRVGLVGFVGLLSLGFLFFKLYSFARADKNKNKKNRALQKE